MPRKKTGTKMVLDSFYVDPALKDSLDNLLKKSDVQSALHHAGIQPNRAAVTRSLLKLFNHSPIVMVKLMVEAS